LCGNVCGFWVWVCLFGVWGVGVGWCAIRMECSPVVVALCAGPRSGVVGVNRVVVQSVCVV
jgi:hypothetical protein